MDRRHCSTSAAHDIYQERLKVQSVALFQSKEECSILKVCSFSNVSSKQVPNFLNQERVVSFQVSPLEY